MLWLIMGVLGAFAQDRGARGDDAGFGSDSGEYVPAPKRRFYYSNATFARVNPLGLINSYRMGIRRRLSTKDSLLFRDTYAFVGLNSLTTPAFARLGAYGEAQLLSVLRVFGQFEGVGYFSTFDQVLSFPAGQPAQYSDQEIVDLGDAGQNAARSGWVATLGFTVRAAAGPIAIRTTGNAQRYMLNLPDGEVAFYDQFWDRLAPNNGWSWLQDTDVLLIADKARIGVRHTFTTNLVDEEAPDRNIGEEGALSHNRIGPLFAFQFKDKAPGTRFNQPTFFVVAQWWLQHPYRTGTFERDGQTVGSSQLFPLIATGLAFNGDFATSKRAKAAAQ